MSNYILSNLDQAPVVVVLQFGVFRIRQGRPAIFNSLNVSKMYINEDIHEINEFKMRYLGSLPPESSSSSRFSAPTIRVIICGKILPMSKYMQWYYVGCKVCTKLVKDRVNNEGAIEGSHILNQFRVKYYCNQKCNGAIVEGVARYRINLAVQDDTGIVHLSLWEGHANRLLKISVYDLLLKVINGPPNSDLFHEELKNPENKQFAFKIFINQFNLENRGSDINISKLTEDTFILAELQKKLHPNQQLESDSTVVDASVDTFSVKDVISVTDDNLKAVEKSTAKTIASNNEKTSPTYLTPTLKRNLIDVYNVDDPPTQSTTKSHSVTTVGGEENGKPYLLIPKMEK